MVAWSRQVTPAPMVSGRLRAPAIVVVHPPTAIDKFAIALSPAESAARTLKSNMPASTARPAMAPAGLSDSPGGSARSETDQVYGATPPLTVSIGMEYRAPSVALGRLVVATDSGQTLATPLPGCCEGRGQVRSRTSPRVSRAEVPDR